MIIVSLPYPFWRACFIRSDRKVSFFCSLENLSLSAGNGSAAKQAGIKGARCACAVGSRSREWAGDYRCFRLGRLRIGSQGMHVCSLEVFSFTLIRNNHRGIVFFKSARDINDKFNTFWKIARKEEEHSCQVSGPKCREKKLFQFDWRCKRRKQTMTIPARILLTEHSCSYESQTWNKKKYFLFFQVLSAFQPGNLLSRCEPLAKSHVLFIYFFLGGGGGGQLHPKPQIFNRWSCWVFFFLCSMVRSKRNEKTIDWSWP